MAEKEDSLLYYSIDHTEYIFYVRGRKSQPGVCRGGGEGEKLCYTPCKSERDEFASRPELHFSYNSRLTLDYVEHSAIAWAIKVSSRLPLFSLLTISVTSTSVPWGGLKQWMRT